MTMVWGHVNMCGPMVGVGENVGFEVGDKVGFDEVGFDVVGFDVVGLTVVGLTVVGFLVVGFTVVGLTVVGLDDWASASPAARTNDLNTTDIFLMCLRNDTLKVQQKKFRKCSVPRPA